MSSLRFSQYVPSFIAVAALLLTACSSGTALLEAPGDDVVQISPDKAYPLSPGVTTSPVAETPREDAVLESQGWTRVQKNLGVCENGVSIVPVLYGTNREPVHERVGLFNGERVWFKDLDRNLKVGELHHGISYVNVPCDREQGEIPRPVRIGIGDYAIYTLSADPQKHFVILSASRLSGNEFVEYVRSGAEGTGDSVFLFIHGYNNSFRDAVYRTAQLAHDLNMPGLPVLFSWASFDSVPKYGGDHAVADRSYPALRKFLAKVAVDSGAKNVYVVAHSMGAYTLARAVHSLDQPDVRFSQLILAAPDIDAGLFRYELFEKLQQRTERSTIYVARKDKALTASKRVWAFNRLGLGEDAMFDEDSLDFVDMEDIDLSLLGHSDFAQHFETLEDMRQVIRGISAEDRKTLVRSHWPHENAWKIARSRSQ